MSSVSNEIQLREEIRRLKHDKTQLEERLEYFIDKYGLPSTWPKPERKPDVIKAPTNTSPTVVTNNEDNLIGLHQSLVTNSVVELLIVQLNDALSALADQNKQTIQSYKALEALKKNLGKTGK